MVSQTEGTTSRIQKEHARCHSSTEDEIASHGNVAFCWRLTMQTKVSPMRYRGMFHAASMIMKEEERLAVYKVSLPSVIGVILYVGLNFAVYESLKDWLMKRNVTSKQEENADLSVLTKLGCGAVAITMGQTVAYPLDVVRRRMQMVGWKDASSVIITDGLIPNSIKVVPSISLDFATYEVMKNILGVKFQISN
ncbi:hypothetical protein GOP47_0009496 [Adiantum capillus-veneris]|uniref:Uncharacterized protein n=1 Tax=Adiantum capillus-veneris TaxID=13818 RepID=A0A9D4UWB3_ADICA|nr:hypothetical protein GOP47_0009496 [Adiantum capillus-veneris]